jgi:DNA-binding MarR family transcriptional regulator
MKRYEETPRASAGEDSRRTRDDRQGPDDDVSAAELTERIMRVAHLIRRSSMASMAALDLTPAQSRALRVISRADQPIRMGELASILGVVPRSATGLVDALQEAGLVERAVDRGNRRAVLVTLTEHGRDRQRAIAQARAAAGDGLFGSLSPDERRLLAKLLGQIG